MRGAIRAVDAFLREREPWLRRHLRAQQEQRVQAAQRRLFGPDRQVLFRLLTRVLKYHSDKRSSG